MLNPFIELFATVISIYVFAVFAWAILHFLAQFDILNRYNPLVARVLSALSQLVEPALTPFRRLQRKLLPSLYAIDLSPIALILALHFVKNALFQWFYKE
jgi:YggT family protein